MREIGGAAGVAAMSTALVSRTGLDGFRAALMVKRFADGVVHMTTAREGVVG
jgi:hypothetical protein